METLFNGQVNYIDMKQTPVEWLMQQLPTIDKYDPYYQNLFNQAKDMEKEQIMMARYMAKDKQTAVEYIREKLLGNEYWYEGMTFDQIIDKAKEIEKEQSFAFFKAGQESMEEGGKGFEQYYNENYESKTNL